MYRHNKRSMVLRGSAAVIALTALVVMPRLIHSESSAAPPEETHAVGPFFLDSSLTLEVINAGPTINGSGLDYAPVISPDGAILYFTSDRRDSGSMGATDLWGSAMQLGDTSFSRPQNLGDLINTKANEGSMTLTADGRHLFYGACDRKMGLGNCDIFEATFDDQGMIVAQHPLNAINSEYWESNPSITPDGKTLYFASNRPRIPGGTKNEDIWVSIHYHDGTWSTPRNLGEPINSKDRETGPCIVGDHLYFASDRPHGFGHLDFYVSTMKKDDSWETPVNLGSLFNTSSDERYIFALPDSPVIFFSSDRRDLQHYGELDIYMARPYDGK